LATKTERIDARLSPDERALIDRAAAVTGTSSSAFLVSAAVDRADQVLAASMVTVTPADYFDQLQSALDDPDSAPRLTRAAAKAGRNSRIARH
jgi:uncharacterized protein (DUF1778 family)